MKPSKSVDPPENQNAIIWAACLEIANGNASIAEELLTAFVAELPMLFQEIEKAHDNKDYEALYKIIHKLHGGCCYSCVPKLKSICQLFEAMLKDNQHQRFEVHYPKLQTEVDNVLTCFARGNYR